MDQDEAASSSPRPLKRVRADQDTGIGRRKSACQTCRLRKIKCDLKRPQCSLCQTSGTGCVYLTEPPKQTLESVAKILTGRLDTVTKQLEDLKASVEVNGARGQSRPGSIGAVTSPVIMIDPHDHQTAPEPSRDFSHIPPHQTTADTILTWPIFENKFTENFLIEPLLTDPAVSDPQLYARSGSNEDNYAMIASLAPLDEERIPSLVDHFLQNVHTKNPVIDVETLVQRSRLAATQGLGWDAWSCLVLLACALGSIAKPFGAWEKLPESEVYFRTPATQKELQQAENCFVLAGRRLGLLKQTMLAAQCHFFAGGESA
jgi:Fungal Zn(2)-Cys(6) binuclear cluster domain